MAAPQPCAEKGQQHKKSHRSLFRGADTKWGQKVEDINEAFSPFLRLLSPVHLLSPGLSKNLSCHKHIHRSHIYIIPLPRHTHIHKYIISFIHRTISGIQVSAYLLSDILFLNIQTKKHHYGALTSPTVHGVTQSQMKTDGIFCCSTCPISSILTTLLISNLGHWGSLQGNWAWCFFFWLKKPIWI